MRLAIFRQVGLNCWEFAFRVKAVGTSTSRRDAATSNSFPVRPLTLGHEVVGSCHVSYRRTCLRYSSVRQIPGEPDPFRLTHRDAISETLHEVATGLMNKAAAVRHIARRAGERLPAAQRALFMEAVENSLGSLHAGNIARFRLRPAVFSEWKSKW